MKTVIAALLAAAFLASAPFAAAEEESEKPDETEPEDGGNAWVEDCPEDMMCAFGGGSSGMTVPEDEGDGTCDADACSHAGAPDEPVSSDDGATCMDGSATDCDDGRQYFGGDADGREPGAPDAESHAGRSDGDDAAKAVPALGLSALLAALGVGAVAAAFRRV